MKVLELAERGALNTLTSHQLKIADHPKPVPGRGEVLIRMEAASLNFRDLVIIQGGMGYGDDFPLPFIPFSDGAGVIEEVGEDVFDFRPGDRVCPLFYQDWSSGALHPGVADSVLFGPRHKGVAREYMVLNAAGVAKYADHLTPLEASTYPCAGVTAWNALVDKGRVKAGDTVLLQGTGGVSTHALTFAKAFGARVILISSDDEKLEKAGAQGADHLINYRNTPDWDDAALEITGGRGVDIVIDVAGGEGLRQSIHAVRPEGYVAAVGVVSGVTNDLFIPDLMMKAIRLQGVSIGHKGHFQDMMQAVAQNRLRPAVDRTFPLSDAAGALIHLQSGKHYGKVVVTI